MHVIARRRLNEFTEKYPGTENALVSWYSLIDIIGNKKLKNTCPRNTLKTLKKTKTNNDFLIFVCFVCFVGKYFLFPIMSNEAE